LSIVAVFIAIRVNQNPYKLPTDVIWYSIGGLVYIIGAILYIVRIPERCSPGKFDYCGASH
jgi:predicted membrane channel-forming protein YqfA (hemolysin III family)